MLIVLVSGCGSESTRAANADEALARACAFLRSRQGADGGWHSEHYGALRPGRSLTPFVLDALLQADAIDDAAAKRAVGFLADHTDPDGCLGRVTDAVPDYPNYATGYALSALKRLPAAHAPADLVARMERYLAGQQFREEGGWRPSDPAYGGWGLGGVPRRGPGDPGHVDLSMTRVALQALRPEGVVAERARSFVFRCTSERGGCFYSPVVLGTNKAGAGIGYGTATADGVLALLACGVGRDDARVRALRAFLIEHHRTDRVPGIPVAAPGGWSDSLRFYYLAVAAEALAACEVERAPPEVDWRSALSSALIAAQRPDGSFANPHGTVKEDDPLIATTLALRALLAAR